MDSPKNKDWLKTAAVTAGLLAAAFGGATYLFQTRAAASEQDRRMDGIEYRVTTVEKVVDKVEAIDRNLIRLMTELRVRPAGDE